MYERDVQKAVRASFEEAMIGAGFNVLTDPALPHDLLARVEVHPGSRLETGARVRAVLTLEARGKAIDRFEVSAPQEAAGYGGVVADQLVDGIFRSGELAVFTRALRNPRSSEHLAASALRVALAPRPCGKDLAAAGPGGSPTGDAISPAPAPPPPAAPSPFLSGPAQPAAYAFIVGVDEYKSAPRLPSARADAERFAELCRRTLGVADNHLKVVVGEKADKLAFDLNAEWLKLNVPRGGRVYFYFSGRGALDRKLSHDYLLPADGDPRALDRTAVGLSTYLQVLSQTAAREVIAIVDTAYSGSGTRSVASGEGRGPATIGSPAIPPHVVLLSAVTSAESAGDVPGGGSGLFSHYLDQGLGLARADVDGDGSVSLHELLSWAGPRVTRDARRESRAQTPAALLAPGMPDPAHIVVVSGLPPE